MRIPLNTARLGILCLLIFSFFTSYAQTAIVESKVNAEEIQRSLKYLASDELNGRETGTEGIEKAAVFIEQRFKDYNLKPLFSTYRDSFMVEERHAYNLVGVLEGTDAKLKEEFIVIGAHYDHIGNAKPVEGDSVANGANDNATGTVGVLELANHFANSDANRRSIIFALFSGEEMGLTGSRHLAEKLKNSGLDIYTMINLEMIGVPMKAKDYKAYVTGFEASNLADKFNEYSGGESVVGYLPQAAQMNLFKRSDNYPFYKAMKIPAQTICTFDFSNYPYYHHVNDEAEYMDALHMADLLESLLPGLKKMANTIEKEIKLNE